MNKTNGEPLLYYIHPIFPLRVIKQIITMFFSVNYDGFASDNPELVKFVLNRDSQFIDPNKYRVWCYYKKGGSTRHLGTSVMFDPKFGGANIISLSEIAFSPFGYVLTYGSVPPDRRLVDITHFSNYGYNDQIEMPTRFPVLSTHLPNIPGDYRTAEEINSGILKANMLKMGKIKSGSTKSDL